MSLVRPRIGVVTVTYNAAEYIETFLECCRAQDHDNFELLIIDNASSDTTTSLAARCLDSRFRLIINDQNVGYAAACNQAIEYYKLRGAELVLFINNDTEFEPDLFRALDREIHAQRADGIVPRIVLASDTRLNWYAGGRFVFWKSFQAEMIGENRFNDPRDTLARFTPVAPGCCIMFTRGALEAIGKFDETFFVYFEDTDYCLRMAYAGRKLLYVPTIRLIHKVSASTGGPVSKFSVRFYNRNQMYILRKHFAWPLIAVQLPLIVAKAILRLIRGRDTTEIFVLRLKATWEGLCLPLPADTWSHYRPPR